MNREKKTIFLVVLTLLAYGFTIFFDKGSFILPFPIFDFILLLIAIQFSIWNWRDILSFRKWYFYIYFIALITKLLTNQLLWSVLLDDRALSVFNETMTLDLLKLGFNVLIIAVFFTWSFVEKLKYKWLVPLILSIIHLVGLTEQTYYLSYLSLPLFSLNVFDQKPKNSLTYLLILNALLDLMSLFMLTMVN